MERNPAPIAVIRLDHVNIITRRLDETAAFYTGLLGLVRRDGPPPLTPDEAQWMHDAQGRAILHLNSPDCPRRFDRRVEPGVPTGAVHHVALACSGIATVLSRLEAMALDFKVSEVPAIGLTQIFVHDPNGVLLELNFHAG